MAGARSGNAFISSGSHEAADAFRMGVVAGERTLAGMGGTALLLPGVRLRAGFQGDPGKRLLYRILRDGEEVAWILWDDLEWRPDRPGTYRIEVYTYSGRIGRLFIRLRPWIFGNPVDLVPPGSESTGGSTS
jgi:hypothetical protein